MQNPENRQVAKTNHRKVQSSTTLNRKSTRQPKKNLASEHKIQRSPKIQRFSSREQMSEEQIRRFQEGSLPQQIARRATEDSLKRQAADTEALWGEMKTDSLAAKQQGFW